ncbi:hypothetical protein BTUL_0274g00030 [Botrytis tulipae]|uniref:Uncharacterized protein n=1 Tax=Botrytis tulipae TaxID=87230 RepID=A0A4Z1EDM6_9HELO|nr:hypothetical protein BTUL_0274g00030 [Botrytis tulipae]
MPVKTMELYDVGPAGMRTYPPSEVQSTPPRSMSTIRSGQQKSFGLRFNLHNMHTYESPSKQGRSSWIVSKASVTTK